MSQRKHEMIFCCSLAVYQLISRRRFQQMEVLEGQNILVTISGKKNKIRVYYLSWLKAKIFKADTVSVSIVDSLHSNWNRLLFVLKDECCAESGRIFRKVPKVEHV